MKHGEIMKKTDNDWDMYCEKCGYKFKHGGMKTVPWKKVGLYACPDCGHDVQIARNPTTNIVIGRGSRIFEN